MELHVNNNIDSGRVTIARDWCSNSYLALAYPSPPASSPPIELHCPPSPEDIYHSTSPDLLDFTPGLLTAESGRLIFRRVAPAQVNAWLRRYPEVVENPDIRYEYDSLTQRFMIKCSHCAVHESFSIFFTTDVILGMASKLGSRTVKKLLQVSSGSAFSGFSSEYAVDLEKIPDAFAKVVGITHPSVVVETGWAEKMADLRKDGKIWLCGTKGVTRVVIVVCFTEGKSPIAIPTEPDEESLDKDEHSAAGMANQNTVGAATPHEPSQEPMAEDANSGHDEKIPNSISSTTLPSV